MDNKKNHSGLIWITGFSSSGKTTISREVNNLLKKDGYSTIFLDGDDLRKIFGNTWGYDRENRVDLAQIYLRLCNHLSSQGHTVIISAIGMFSPLYEWMNENVENAIQIYLSVPSQIRLERDRLTKQIYIENELNDDFYDIPKNPNLIIENYGNKKPLSAAKEIVDLYTSPKSNTSEVVKTRHWENYYKKKKHAPTFPSPFAEYVSEQLDTKANILEIGCGNGRDSKFFSSLDHCVTGIDTSVAAIEFCKKNYDDSNIKFFSGNITEINSLEENQYDVIYSRFVLHAMSLVEEIETLKISYELLKRNGLFYIECRSVNDPLYRQGDILSHTERVDGHYRRFIILKEIQERLCDSGFTVIESNESNGLAKFGDEDPVVIRLKAIKN